MDSEIRVDSFTNRSGLSTVDRFQLAMSSLGTWTVDQDTNAPNGFSNIFKMTCTTAEELTSEH